MRKTRNPYGRITHVKEAVKGQPFRRSELEEKYAKNVMLLQDKAEEINRLLAKKLGISDKDFVINYHDNGLWIQLVDDIKDGYDYSIMVNATKMRRDEIEVDSIVRHQHQSWTDVPEDADANTITDAIIEVLEKDGRI